jgi:hypothetical protein
MFRLTTAHLYWWPVEVKVPTSDPNRAGAIDAMTMKLRFRAIGQDEAQRIDMEIAQLPAEERIARQHEHLERVTVDWADVLDDHGEAVPFSDAVFHQAMQMTWFRLAVYEAYAKSLRGEEARLKN